MSKPALGFDTLAVYAGAEPDPATGARQVPIYQTTSNVFRDAGHAARLFIYSRLTTPTVAALAARVAALEDAAGGIACSSGHAAQIMALFPLMGPGCNVASSSRLYGGTVTQFSHTIRRFGWSATFVDMDDLAAVDAAIDEDTRALFCETIANPGGHVTTWTMAAIAQRAGIPLIVDNPTATPWLCRPIDHGATLVVHSATKYLTGNGTVTGGVVVDSGTFDWAASDKFPSFSHPAYHGLGFATRSIVGDQPGVAARKRRPPTSEAICLMLWARKWSVVSLRTFFSRRIWKRVAPIQVLIVPDGARPWSVSGSAVEPRLRRGFLDQVLVLQSRDPALLAGAEAGSAGGR